MQEKVEQVSDGARYENLGGQVVMQRCRCPVVPSILPKSEGAYAPQPPASAIPESDSIKL